MFSWEYCEVFKNSFFIEDLRWLRLELDICADHLVTFAALIHLQRTAFGNFDPISLLSKIIFR